MVAGEDHGVDGFNFRGGRSHWKKATTIGGTGGVGEGCVRLLRTPGAKRARWVGLGSTGASAGSTTAATELGSHGGSG